MLLFIALYETLGSLSLSLSLSLYILLSKVYKIEEEQKKVTIQRLKNQIVYAQNNKNVAQLVSNRKVEEELEITFNGGSDEDKEILLDLGKGSEKKRIFVFSATKSYKIIERKNS